jgi:hypothetical protein
MGPAQVQCLLESTITGVVRAPDFVVLFNNIQYKEWNCPSTPRKYLVDPKPKSTPSGAKLGGAGLINAGRMTGATPSTGGGRGGTQEHQRLHNLKFQKRT